MRANKFFFFFVYFFFLLPALRLSRLVLTRSIFDAFTRPHLLSLVFLFFFFFFFFFFFCLVFMFGTGIATSHDIVTVLMLALFSFFIFFNFFFLLFWRQSYFHFILQIVGTHLLLFIKSFSFFFGIHIYHLTWLIPIRSRLVQNLQNLPLCYSQLGEAIAVKGKNIKILKD